MIEGLFIAIEGVDGAGTTTQASRLTDWLRGRGLPAHVTREPSDGPIGAMIRQVLAGRLVVPSMHGVHAPGWATMSLLFAADRMDHLETEIIPNLLDGVTVISDRYDHSSVAYQTALAGGAPAVAEWLRTINGRARRPDLTLVLDVDPDVAAARRESRMQVKDLYEVDELQVRLGQLYGDIERYFPGDRIVHVDGNRGPDEVAAAIEAEVCALRGE